MASDWLNIQDSHTFSSPPDVIGVLQRPQTPKCNKLIFSLRTHLLQPCAILIKLRPQACIPQSIKVK